MENKKRKQPGRKKVVNPRIYRYSINLDEPENEKFRALLRKNHVSNISKFIVSVLLNKEIKVVVIDKASKDYYMRLTNIYEQYRHIGVNYNQVVKALKTNFAEKRALAMLYRLEKMTIELVKYSHQVLEITREYERKWLRK
jgi:hypothetical protein